MKTIKFYADENFPSAIIEELRQLDYDILTSYEAGQANKSISDENVLKFAQERNKIIITLNRDDFVSLHKQGKAHSGIIICKEDRDYKGQAQAIYEFILQDGRSLQGRLIRIKKHSSTRNVCTSFCCPRILKKLEKNTQFLLTISSLVLY